MAVTTAKKIKPAAKTSLFMVLQIHF